MTACLHMLSQYPRDIEICLFFARFIVALANPQGPSNPNSAIQVQFIIEAAIC